MDLPQNPLHPDHILDRVFFFTIFLPYLRLDERLGRNVLIDPTFNDACLLAADISVAAFHFVEQARHVNPKIAKALRSFPDWKLLSDIANSRKHYLRGDASNQITLIGRLLFEKSDELGFSFIETEIIAVDSVGGEHDVPTMLLSYVNLYRELRAGDPSVRLVPNERKSGPFYPEARMAFSFETFAIGASSLRVVKRNSDGLLVNAGAEEFRYAVEQRVSETTTIGRWQIQQSVEAVEKWFDDIDREIEQTGSALKVG